jgi:hypothetical protein
MNRMKIRYDNQQRVSSHDTTSTIDLPMELLGKILIHLVPRREDLIASSQICRTWHYAARGLLNYRLHIDKRSSFSRICGLQLKSICLGLDSLKIKCLDVDLINVGQKYLSNLTRLVSPLLRSLKFNFYNSLRSDKILEIFLINCRKIRKLELVQFDFGIGSFSPQIRTGLSVVRPM